MEYRRDGFKSTGDTRLTTTSGNVTLNANLGNTTNTITRVTSAGNITEIGRASCRERVYDTVTGVGVEKRKRVGTTATTLAARTTASGGVLVSESDGVSLTTTDGVTNATASNGEHTASEGIC